MTSKKLPKPMWEGNGVRLFHAKAEDITKYFEERGSVFMDPPYSKHVHSKSRAGARAEPLASGNGKVGKAAISRAVDFGFEYLNPKLRRFLAQESARLSKRWTLTFCDMESTWLWRLAFMAAGLDFRRTCIWEKLACTPQFQGDQPAVACETIVAAHASNGSPTANFDLREMAMLAKILQKGSARKKDIERLVQMVLADLQSRHPTCPECDGEHGAQAVLCSHPFTGKGRERRRWNGGGKRGIYSYPVVVERFGGEVRTNETEKPIGLILELMSDFTDEGELVYDFCAGGGTTGIAGMRLKRRVDLIEMREVQALKTAERLEAEAMGLSLMAKRAGQLGLFAPKPVQVFNQYVNIGGEKIPINTNDEVGAASRALLDAGVDKASVYQVDPNMPEGGHATGNILFAGKNVECQQPTSV